MPDIEAREAFPKILAAYMEQHNMKQTDVARSVHVSKQIVSDWLRGKKFPRVNKMQELADLFGVLMSDMYTLPKTGVVLKVNDGKRSSFADAIVKAAVKMPDNIKLEGTKFVAEVNSPKKDRQTNSMMKLWEVATPETKTAILGILKTMNRATKK